MKKITIIIPVKDEEGNVEMMADELKRTFEMLPYAFNVLFVDDGSTDKTSCILKKIYSEDDRFGHIILSKNFGHQNALKSGIDAATGHAVIMMDGDMQHPPGLIAKLLQKFEEGYDIVNTSRIDTGESSGALKKWTSKMFYRQLNRLTDVQIPTGSADFRLISNRVLKEVKKMNEYDLFYRGLVMWIGFKQTTIEYIPNKRHSGKSKYSLTKMIRFGIQGVTSFSVKPLHLAVYIGLAVSVLSLLYIPYVLYSLFSHHAIAGWASTIVTIAFLGGLQLMVLGIIGIYIGKIFVYTKGRPHYIVRESTLMDIKQKDAKIYNTA